MNFLEMPNFNRHNNDSAEEMLKEYNNMYLKYM